MTKFKGKLIGGVHYFHKSALNLVDSQILPKIHKSIDSVGDKFDWNVVKFDRTTAEISLLDYESFEESEFPALLKSCQINISTGNFKIRNHSANNPPILHRKELLLPPSNENFKLYEKLTRDLEKIGAFANITRLGTKISWDLELSNLGITVKNHEVVDLEVNTESVFSQNIVRYRTAISRNSLSTPSKLLFQAGLANEDSSFLDYGCGRGDDIKFFKELGVSAIGWDPHFQNDTANLVQADIVNLGFVLNVIEDPEERMKTLKRAYSLATKCLSVAVMLQSQNDLASALPFNDGCVTSIKTFQKFYTQSELEELLQSELKATPIAAAPGIFFVFKDEAAEQDYLLKRQLGIVRDYDPKNLVTKANERKEKSELALRVANNLAKHIISFARKPEIEELPRYFKMQLEKSGVSFRRAFDAASQLITEDDLKNAVIVKKEQLILFFAMYFFSGRAKYKNLAKSLQKDVRLHFGSMLRAEEAAKELLFSLGKEELIYQDSYKSTELGLGHVTDGKFSFQIKNLKKLPLRLRGVMSIAERLAGAVEDANIVRIHIETKKVTFLTVPNFDTSPLPRISKRSIVDFRQHEVKSIIHDQGGRVKTIYLKSVLMNPKEKNYQIQKVFDDKILSESGFEFLGEGPPFEDFAKTLLEKKIFLPAYT